MQNDEQVESPCIENESQGCETACFRKCRGQFVLTPDENRYEHEIPLDFSTFNSDLKNFSNETYERIEHLLKLDHSIERIRKLIDNKHITCVDLCLFYLKRIQMTNNYYKVFLELNPNVLSDARQLDQELNTVKHTNKLLFGCVAGIKGNISINHMYNDAGAYVLHEKRMTHDAPIVTKLREQGREHPQLSKEKFRTYLFLRLSYYWSNEFIRMGVFVYRKCSIGILGRWWTMFTSG